MIITIDDRPMEMRSDEEIKAAYADVPFEIQERWLAEFRAWKEQREKKQSQQG